MKKLGILDVQGLNHDEALLHYFNLFKGPLTDDAAKALTLNCQILNWNVRGLNDGARQDSVCEFVRTTAATIVCLQETKMQVMDHNVVRRTVGPKFVNSYTVLPAEQTRGGVFLAVNEDYFDLSDIVLTSNAITVQINMRADGTRWQIMVVYGPQREAAKLQFLQELKNIPPSVHNRWLILGDFNLIYQAKDKNNSNLNQRLMGAFRAAIDHLRPVTSTLPMKRLHIKMARVAKAIKRWKKDKIGDMRIQLAIVKEVLLQLEAAQEHRLLTAMELHLCRRLKSRSIGLGLAAIEKSRIRQRSRLTYIRCGDTNTKFFHSRANARWRKNYIHCLHTDGGIAVAQQDKEKVIQDYFTNHIGSAVPRASTINWQSLGYNQHDLSDLEMPFS
ncbi:unnamed protein product [Miscanthus lutarioriparius]|uniref:Endonuclease/exonuclease/phosphatase domain-containing protein n=1 Tax=Miscanthus lutarioriparius TaxID=422564 RepID=A0A811PF27_9POAL|nr:unnamed protein product [Miscanthus lutarioriparius]